MARHHHETEQLLACSSREERDTFLRGLFRRHEDRLRRMIELRTDPRLRGRIDPGEVIREAHREACDRVEEYLGDRSVRLYVWVRSLAARKPEEMSRRYLLEEEPPRRSGEPPPLAETPRATPRALAKLLLGRGLTRRPSDLEAALLGMDPIDREVIALRNFERLSSIEAAQVLGITESASRRRYLGALATLKDAILDVQKGRERTRG